MENKKYDYFQVNLTKIENNNSYILAIFKKDLYNMLKNEKSIIISEEPNYAVEIYGYGMASNVMCLENNKKCFYIGDDYLYVNSEDKVKYYQYF